MKFTILHESRGRMRIHLALGRMTMDQADAAEVYIKNILCVRDAAVYDRTCDAVIHYTGDRKEVINALSRASFEKLTAEALIPEHSARQLNREFEDKLVGSFLKRIVF